MCEWWTGCSQDRGAVETPEPAGLSKQRWALTAVPEPSAGDAARDGARSCLTALHPNSLEKQHSPPPPCPQLSGTRGPRDPPQPSAGLPPPSLPPPQNPLHPTEPEPCLNTEGALLGYTQLAINPPRAPGAGKSEPTEQSTHLTLFDSGNLRAYEQSH